MWEKISKEMQLPWRAAEAMHWQIGEVEMAQRANVPVFHLAGQGGPPTDMHSSSTSPSSVTAPVSAFSYSHTHSHALPQLAQLPPPVSPTKSRLRRNSSGPSSPSGLPSPRRRADSARSLHGGPLPGRALLPPLGEITGGPSPVSHRYTLPPVVTSPGGRR